MGAKFDFSGWATMNDLLCSDGRTIRHGAFRGDDGKTVDLVWNHRHKDKKNIIGKALLKNCDEGVYAYGIFNDTPKAQAIKDAVIHGKLNNLSIYANDLVEKDGDVFYGEIQEVSLVRAGANPGAMIDSVIAHSDDPEYDFDEKNRAVIFSGEPIVLYHSAEEPEDDKKTEDDDETIEDIFNSLSDKQKDAVYFMIHEVTKKGSGDAVKHSDDSAKDGDETVEDVFNTLSDKQKDAVYFMIGEVAKKGTAGRKDDDQEADDKSNKEDKEVKHNVFQGNDDSQTLVHMDMKQMLQDGKRLGRFSEAVIQHAEENDMDVEEYIQHDAERYGIMGRPGDTNSLGIDALFPDYKAVNGATPEFIQRNMDWVNIVMNGVHHTPFSRIKSVFADITEDEARARGYIKGNKKKDEVFSLLKRTTDPQTIYKRQKLDQDDINDIVDFDVVAWIKAEMRMMLEEEIARAILVGDGRLNSDDDKIKEDHVRSIYHDDDFYSIKVAVRVSASATDDEISKAAERAIVKARKDYKGSGNPIFFTTPEVLTNMLLQEDGIGHRLYKTEQELATALRVSRIVEVEVMENQTRKGSDNVTRPLMGIIVNLNDYNVGADKGGAVKTFEDFDIDYNQNKYLIETRISGALIKPASAMVIELEQAVASGNGQ